MAIPDPEQPKFFVLMQIKPSTICDVLSHKINAVSIDCTGLEYISSAGLRVILIMHKACTEGVTISGANNAIKEILSQTGFDSIITIV